MSEILKDIQVKFPKFNLNKLKTGQAKKIANSFFRTKGKRLSIYSAENLKKIKKGGKNIFSSFEENGEIFYKLELVQEQ